MVYFGSISLIHFILVNLCVWIVISLMRVHLEIKMHELSKSYKV
jgi:hypothetical protein